MTGWSRRVGAAFGQAAASYDEAAELQYRVARSLAARIAAAAAPALPSVLEVGCGTGRLLPLLDPEWRSGTMVVSDLAYPMVLRARGALPGALPLVMNAEQPAVRLDDGFDLIVSSLAAQWFEAPARTLAGLAALLAPGGRMLVTTLAAGSLGAWRQAVADETGTAARDYPTPDDWLGMLPPTGERQVAVETIAETYPDGLAFLRGLKRIGAGVPGPGSTMLGPASLRRVLRRLELADGFAISWQIASLDYRAPPR